MGRVVTVWVWVWECDSGDVVMCLGRVRVGHVGRVELDGRRIGILGRRNFHTRHSLLPVDGPSVERSGGAPGGDLLLYGGLVVLKLPHNLLHAFLHHSVDHSVPPVEVLKGKTTPLQEGEGGREGGRERRGGERRK